MFPCSVVTKKKTLFHNLSQSALAQITIHCCTLSMPTAFLDMSTLCPYSSLKSLQKWVHLWVNTTNIFAKGLALFSCVYLSRTLSCENTDFKRARNIQNMQLKAIILKRHVRINKIIPFKNKKIFLSYLFKLIFQLFVIEFFIVVPYRKKK